MVEKRKYSASTPQSAEHTANTSKRRRVSDQGSPITTPSRSQPDLTGEQRRSLKEWLNKRVKTAHGVAFSIQYSSPRPKKTSKKSKKQNAKPVAGTIQENLNLSGQSYGAVSYSIQNRPKWDQLTRYKKFALTEETIEIGQCILVRGDTDPDVDTFEDGTLHDWKAQLLEVRALDPNHVYLRVAWLYRPAQDLPTGPTPYHGKYELIPSTEISIIDAASVYGSFKVKYWDEYKDDDVPTAEEYYWRQSYAHISGTLSACRQVCTCSQPHNPDIPILQCKHCQQWMHAECLEKAAVKKYLKEAAAEVNGTHGESNNETVDSTAGSIDFHPQITATVQTGDRDQEMDSVAGGASTQVILRDDRSGEPSVHELDIKCLFEECGKTIDD